MNQFAAQNGFILTSNGLGARSMNADSRKMWRERRERYGVKMGYAEWGPSGRDVQKLMNPQDWYDFESSGSKAGSSAGSTRPSVTSSSGKRSSGKSKAA